MPHRHAVGDRGAGQVDQLGDRRVEVEAALVDQLQCRHGGGQLGDRRRVEPGRQGDGHGPSTAGRAVGAGEQRLGVAAGVPADQHDAGEVGGADAFGQPGVQVGERHGGT
jgi:hypothetical protein